MAGEAKYHQQCKAHFFCKDIRPKDGASSANATNPTMQCAFNHLCGFLESNEECQYSVSELKAVMERYFEENDIDGCGYSVKQLKRKLIVRFGDRIHVTEIPGKDGIVTFKDKSYRILHNQWYNDRLSDEVAEKRRIVETAAAIVRDDIRDRVFDCSSYSTPFSAQEHDNIPNTLKCFVEGIVETGKVNQESVHKKCIAIEEAIIAATRPRSYVSNALLSVAVYIHRKYGS